MGLRSEQAFRHNTRDLAHLIADVTLSNVRRQVANVNPRAHGCC